MVPDKKRCRLELSAFASVQGRIRDFRLETLFGPGAPFGPERVANLHRRGASTYMEGE